MIKLIGHNMFEYDNKVFRVFGFNKISYIDDHKFILLYKDKQLTIEGRNLKADNLMDNSIEVKGIIELVNLEYYNQW